MALPLYSTPEFMTRVGITLGALAVYRLGAHLPLAGIDQAVLAELFRGSGSLSAIERISVFALGVSPIISALLLVEAARLLSRRFNDWAGATPANARRVDRYVLIGSLLLATIQGYGVANGLETAKHLVAEPGVQFRLTVVTTFVASTALLVWLAAMISRHGLGSGVWWLLLVPYLAGLPGLALPVYEAVQSGALSQAGLVAALVYAVIALATLAALARVLAGSGVPLDRTLIWPLFIATYPAGLLRLIPWLFPGGSMRDTALNLLNEGTPLYLAGLAAIVIVIFLAQWRRLRERPTMAEAFPARVDAVGVQPIILTALTLAAITVVPELLATHFRLPILIDGRLITTIVAVALAIEDLTQRRQT